MIPQMDPKTEIRKLPPSITRELAHILDYDESWKRLMSIIPKKLTDDYKCDISPHNWPKYNSENFRILEQASKQYKRSCTEILFDEWGTSGRPRANLGHMKYLLAKAELFRAADHVAELLGEDPPPRPSTGPARNILTNSDPSTAEVERHLDELNYPQIAIDRIRKKSVEFKAPVPPGIPEIVVSEVKTAPESFQIPVVVPKATPQPHREVSDMMKFSESNVNSPQPSSEQIPEISDMVKFSEPNVSDPQPSSEQTDVSVVLPDLSILQGGSDQSKSTVTKDFTPAFSQILPNSIQDAADDSQSSAISYSTDSGTQREGFTPAFSQILPDSVQDADNDSQSSAISYSTDSVTQSDLTSFSQSQNSAMEGFTPAFSQILPNSVQVTDNDSQSDLKSVSQNQNSAIEGFTPALSQLLSDPIQNAGDCIRSSAVSSDSVIQSDHLPALSILNASISGEQSDLIPNFDMLQTGPQAKSSNSSSAKCQSPLPNLSLNTQLPHFSYSELEVATSNFSGQFLGSGAFGSVFLANGLLENPVAVKKILLENAEVVNENDQVTKRFKNEVENLCKYHHENLVSLLGYSCDGSTYCLVYEFVSGGSLFERLRDNPNSLSWKQRLHIALGTSRAVAYLHTALSVPLVHRDIKTANILLDAENNAKVCDFGIAKLLLNQGTNLDTAPYGTSAYMAPEYHLMDISVELDSFSFGVVLLELLTSLPPLDYSRQPADLVSYVDENCEESINPLLDKSVGTWEENGINFADELYQLTLKCLATKEERPQMEDIAKCLEKLEDKLAK